MVQISIFTLYHLAGLGEVHEGDNNILTDGPFLVDFYKWLNLGDLVAKQNNGFNGPIFIIGIFNSNLAMCYCIYWVNKPWICIFTPKNHFAPCKSWAPWHSPFRYFLEETIWWQFNKNHASIWSLWNATVALARALYYKTSEQIWWVIFTSCKG